MGRTTLAAPRFRGAPAVWSVLVGVAVVALAALALRGSGGDLSRHGRPPLAVALIQAGRGSELVAIDLTTMRVARRTRLRSLCLSIAAVPGRREVVTAQCGGPDQAADHAAGIYAPDSGRVSYVDLGVQNPLDVAATPGFALLVHGLERDGELVTSLFALRGARHVKHGRVGAGALRPEAFGPQVLIPEMEGAAEHAAPAGAESFRLTRVAGDGRRSESPTFAAAACRLVADAGRQTDAIYVLVKRSRPDSAGPHGHAGAWGVITLRGPRPSPWTPAPLPLATLDHGCADASLWRGDLAVADADGIDMSDPGDSVAVFDLDTGRRRMRLRVRGGMPAALAEWNGRLLVIDGVTGDLLSYDRAGRLVGRVPLHGVPVGTADLAVLR